MTATTTNTVTDNYRAIIRLYGEAMQAQLDYEAAQVAMEGAETRWKLAGRPGSILDQPDWEHAWLRYKSAAARRKQTRSAAAFARDSHNANNHDDV